jgi:hypothetical protein
MTQTTTSARRRRVWSLGALALAGASALGLAPAAGALGGASAGTVPIAFTLYDPCAGEFVDIAGGIHTVSHVRDRGAGGSQVTFHQNFANVTGVGETSGTEYRVAGSASQTMNVGGARVSSLTVREVFVTRGSAPNQTIGIRMHVTVNADGETTAFVDESATECRG